MLLGKVPKMGSGLSVEFPKRGTSFFVTPRKWCGRGFWVSCQGILDGLQKVALQGLAKSRRATNCDAVFRYSTVVV